MCEFTEGCESKPNPHAERRVLRRQQLQQALYQHWQDGDHHYAGAVSWAVEHGITIGVGGGRFDPTATCTHVQIAAFLARSMK